jgi:ABC transporter
MLHCPYKQVNVVNFHLCSGGILTLPIVFSTLALIQQLRTSIGRQWTRSIETGKYFFAASDSSSLPNYIFILFSNHLVLGSEAVASAMRIEAFLSLAELSEKSESSGAADGSGLEDIYVDKKREETHYVRRESPVPGEDSKVNLTPEQELDLQCGFKHEVNVTYAPVDKALGHLITIPRSSYYYTESGPAPAPRSGQPRHCQDIVPILKDVELSLKRGELILIAGPVGAGKSSLLSVILGEMRRCERVPPPSATVASTGLPAPKNAPQSPGIQSKSSSSSVCYRPICEPMSSSSSSSSSKSTKRVAYCAQRPWILAASVRSNIIVAGKALQTSLLL